MFNVALAELRKTKGLSKSSLANQAGISPTYLGELEAGKKVPTITVLRKIATALDVEPATLLGSVDHPKAKQQA